jgi:hypothetical protein
VNSWLKDFVTVVVLSVFLAVVLLSLTTPFVSTHGKLRSHRMRLCAVNSWLDSIPLVYADAGSVDVLQGHDDGIAQHSNFFYTSGG